MSKGGSPHAFPVELCLRFVSTKPRGTFRARKGVHFSLRPTEWSSLGGQIGRWTRNKVPWKFLLYPLAAECALHRVLLTTVAR